MHFLVFGGSGQTGSELITQALEKGDTVTALVRKAGSVAPRSGLTIVQGQPNDAGSVARAMTTPRVPDAVLVSLASPAQYSRLFFAAPPTPRHLMADSFGVIADAMAQHGVRKVVVLNAFGVGASWANMNFMFKFVFSATSMAYVFDDHNALEAAARARGETLDWVIVKPARLAGDDKPEVKVYGEDGRGIAAMATTTRASVADFMLAMTRDDAWVRKTPVISN